MDSGGATHYFLYRVASDLWGRWVASGDSLAEEMVRWQLFFPSSRSKLHFIEYLRRFAAERKGGLPLVLPVWGDLRSEFARIADQTIVDPLLLLPRLHGKYKELSHESIPLEAFFYWGMRILHDFDQVDKYVADPQLFFRTLGEYRVLDRDIQYLDEEQRELLSRFFSNVSPDPSSELRRRYTEILQYLSPLYTDLQGYMSTQHEGYEGAVFRTCVSRLRRDPSLLIPAHSGVEHLVFIGFNALNANERAFFELAKQGIDTLFYWNYPRRLRSPAHRDAARFVDRNLKLGNALVEEAEEDSSSLPETTLLAVPSVLAQTEVVRDILVRDPSASENAVLVLADEQLLLPLLRILPRSLSYNITMGYPLRNTLVYTLLELLIAWLLHRDSQNRLSSSKELLSFLSHPFLKALSGLSEVRELIEQESDAFNERRLSPGSLLSQWISQIDDNEGRSRFLSLFLVQIGGLMESEESLSSERALWQTYIVTAYERLKGLEQMLGRAGIASTPRLWHQLLPQVFRDVKVPFLGNPLGGLQIMGFLETRALDFDQVTIVSCNEGHLPAIKRVSTFIPTTLGKVFGMPTLEDRESIYSYYFQTIISRARRVRLIYTHSEDAVVGEPSRYVLQQRYASSLPLAVEYPIEVVPSLRKKSPPSVEKTGVVRQVLESFLSGGSTSGLSPTALSEYCICPLRFHFKYIQRISARREVVGVELPPREFGTVIHNTLELLYRDCRGKCLDSDVIASLRGSLSRALETSYRATRGIAQRSLTGIERLECEMIFELLDAQLVFDGQRTPVAKISALEEKVVVSVALSAGRRVNLQGTIDRIDQQGTGYTLIDYKTGSFYEGYLRYRDADRLFSPEPSDRSYLLQILLYCYLWQQKTGISATLLRPALWFIAERGAVDLSLYTLRANGSGKRSFEKLESYSEVSTDFEASLSRTLEELFDWQRPFFGTEKRGHCVTCPYRALCDI